MYLLVVIDSWISVRDNRAQPLSPEAMKDEYAQTLAALERIQIRLRADPPRPRGRKPIHEKWRAQFPRWNEEIKTGRKKLVDLLKEVPEKHRDSVETLYHLSQRREKTKK